MGLDEGLDERLDALGMAAFRLALTRCLQYGAIRNPAWIAAHYGSR